MLPLIESFQTLKNFPIAKYKIIENDKDLSKLEFPYWMKASIPGHKTEENAVIKIQNLKEAKENYLRLRQKLHAPVVIQENAEGQQLILGLKEDKVFGKLLMLGFGGTFAESIKDVSFRALPVEKKDILSMMQELKFYPTLISRKKFALDKFVTLAERVAQLKVKELDLNPVILNEQEAIVVDARLSV